MRHHWHGDVPPGVWRAIAAIAVLALLAVGSTGCFEEPSRPAEGPPIYSPDGRWVAFTNGPTGWPGNELFVATVGGEGEQITEGKTGVWGAFDWSPDGSHLVFNRGEVVSTGLVVVNRDGSGPRRLTNAAHDDYWPCWAADGETIVFARGWDEVYAINVDGTGERRVARHSQWPACSPTEPTIAVADGPSIRIIDLRSGRRRILALPGNLDVYAPSWSPDGSRIAFQDSGGEIYVVSPDGSGLRRLTKSSVGDFFETWLPDGRIVFSSDRAGPNDLRKTSASHYYVMNADGTGVERLEWKPTYSRGCRPRPCGPLALGSSG